ncbi:MAG TPA: IS66 family transposase [Thermoanaerobaculia bacterium]|nr:IS66 family transposase [Thermoanaerobaculia bacterium]
MLKIDRIQDPEQLRRVAVLLDRTVDQLQDRVKEQAFEIARLRGETMIQVDFSFPQAALQKALDGPAETPEKKTSRRPDQPGHGPSPQANLPLVEQVHELPQDERGCSACGGTLDPMEGQYEESEEITVTERSYTLVIHRRQKYRCRCNGCVATAPGPLKLIPGGRYSLDFAVHVAVQKYADHLPLERQVKMMAREGLQVTSQALWDQIEAAGRVLRPTYEAIGAWLMAQPLLHADEGGWLQIGDTGKPKWTAWLLCNPQAAWIRIARSKSEAEGRRLFDGYQGTVVADGYQVYKQLARGRDPDTPGYHLAHCWAHVLRKFRDDVPDDPKRTWILERIGALYKIEKVIALEAGEDSALHLTLRKERAEPITQEIRTWALAQGGLRRGEFGKALAYTLRHWDGLTRFLEDSAVPLDNNPAERALRDLVLGRKNHYGSHSQRGADVAALFYTLIGTAKLCGLKPEKYLREAIMAALKTPGAVTLPSQLLSTS